MEFGQCVQEPHTTINTKRSHAQIEEKNKSVGQNEDCRRVFKFIYGKLFRAHF